MIHFFISTMLFMVMAIAAIVGSIIQDVTDPGFIERATGPFAATVILMLLVFIGGKIGVRHLQRKEEVIIEMQLKMVDQVNEEAIRLRQENQLLREQNDLLHEEIKALLIKKGGDL